MGEEREEGNEEENLREWDSTDGERRRQRVRNESHYKASKKPGTIYILTW